MILLSYSSHKTRLITSFKKNTVNAILFKLCDLVHDFMNFNALKIIQKIHKKKIKKDPGLILTKGNLLEALSTYVHDMKKIPAIVNEKIVIEC